jgi:predicted HAD superfamily Cof-like phosphohydrolase
MKHVVHDVALFHQVTDTPIALEPSFPHHDRLRLRHDLVAEEVDECLTALESKDMVEVADGIIDSIYVLIGMGLELGLPLEALWNEVQRSNMAKAIEQPDGTMKVVKRADQKVLKPAGWTPPDIAGVLRAHGWKG